MACFTKQKWGISGHTDTGIKIKNVNFLIIKMA